MYSILSKSLILLGSKVKSLLIHSDKQTILNSYGSTLFSQATSITQGPGGGKLEGTSLRRNSL